MTALTEEEKQYNSWWMSRFDADSYKMIRLFNHRDLLQTYTTANSRYSDAEDAESAFWTANQANMAVTCVAVGSKRYKKINGKIRQIASMEAAK
ncbi:hypothetical protein IWT25_02313 [Secundilactobacillus pentosiphilus]|uniref:Uncharacterized protein n=1 Tax=Secundilactobacillus pentosiphilus TaxID=1714682 RepID=A0A1Z5IYU9_9LACO|nr:hypothetical protein [Secundilactobacillus pentosiphilus]GAX06965.1 hypothetical protein IWT25_02313 [Secundilactobacillus pentosiphilus]